MDVKYRTRATATGGRDGVAYSDDGHFEARLSTPKELGGAGGEGTNPEQLFAAGYSACFIGALKVAAQQLKLKVPADTTVSATIGIGPRSEGGFGITADLLVTLPGVDRESAGKLVDLAHRLCPYSNATRNNVDVGLTIA
ncbi:organic hydroperoxide resistance protein [Burkholderia sp. Ac-20379]|uniref:organic hydroperoxide resistance protein n=1 Tax=Burkholderia sp. Ac-20379 TaxID=2703900 RepID=UPI0030DCFDFD